MDKMNRIYKIQILFNPVNPVYILSILFNLFILSKKT